MASLREFFQGISDMVGKVEEARDRGETDPLRLLDTLTGGTGLLDQRDEGTWWGLFGLDQRPEYRAELEGAWKRWAARNHPDTGGSAAAFRSMRELYEARVKTLKE